MTLLDEVKELDKVLKMDGYKEWSYSRLTVAKIIKLLETEQLNKPVVMQVPQYCQCEMPTGRTVTADFENQICESCGRLVACATAKDGQRSRGQSVRGGCIDRTRKKDGPCCYPVGTCYDCQVP